MGVNSSRKVTVTSFRRFSCTPRQQSGAPRLVPAQLSRNADTSRPLRGTHRSVVPTQSWRRPPGLAVCLWYVFVMSVIHERSSPFLAVRQQCQLPPRGESRQPGQGRGVPEGRHRHQHLQPGRSARRLRARTTLPVWRYSRQPEAVLCLY